MAEPFVAEIRIFPFNFAPKGWAFCDGQLLPISQNTALFSLLGTTYGGDGKSNFALPNLQGNVPIHPEQGPGLEDYFLGEQSGVDSVTLLQSQMPLHSHALRDTTATAEQNAPGANSVLAQSTGGSAYQSNTSSSLVPMSPSAVAPNGSGFPHNNLQPYLTLNFCIALQGVFPARS